MNINELMDFEKEVAQAFERKEVPGPIHLSGGNEDALIELFAGTSKCNTRNPEDCGGLSISINCSIMREIHLPA